MKITKQKLNLPLIILVIAVLAACILGQKKSPKNPQLASPTWKKIDEKSILTMERWQPISTKVIFFC